MGSPRVVVPKKDVNSHNVSTEVADNPRKGSPRVVVSRNVSTDEVYARSKDADWRHPLPVTTERKALSLLKDKWETNPTHDLPDYNGYYTSKELLTADLHDFEIYTSPFKAKKNWGKFELTSLANLDVRGRELCFDGVLSVGDSAPLAGAPGKQYVQKVPIKGYSIEGYGADDPDTIIYIQSQEASQDEKYDIWYRLRLPSARYQEFHDVFRWVTQLGKHFIDFLEAQPNGVRVGLESFRQDFYRWLIRRFHKNAVFMDWLSLHDSSDFRRSIHAHIDYLRAEAYNLSDSLLEHDLWADCMRDDHRMIKPQPVCCEKTITTPHVFECFKNRYFAKKLLPCQPSKPVQEASERRKRHLGFLPGFPQPSIQRPLQPYNLNVSSFKVGDVVGILPDESEQRLWSKSAPVVNRLWFAYVHRVEGLRLFVIWLYWPENTTISTTDYPVHNELFLSGHCNCQEGELLSTDVVAQCTVDWFATKFNTTKDFICRQKFETKNSSFVSLKQTDFNCECNEEKLSVMDRCRPGDTVYVTKPRDKLLDPVVVHDINRDQKTVMVRRLLRLKNNAQLSRKRQRSQISNNELIWTDEIFKVSFERIQRICYVRHFSEATIVSQEVPFPYNRGGAGDYWILSTEMTLKNGQAKIQFLTTPPSLFQQGPDLNAPFEKLSGLSLFSGVGNLDRGLEEAGAVEFKYSVDMSSEAIHTLRANAPHPGELKLYLGSVDDYLKAALDGKLVELIAQIGHVAVIAAGSPCPGFSTLQHDPFSDRSLRNASHVTTFCSFVDIYRPKYAFLENVVNMSATRKGYESELILQQLIACLVALGYQVQQFIMSSWMYGGPQRRSRLMLSIAAPGLTPLTPPVQTHSHPDGISLKSIGKLSTGQKFGIQEDHPTPFPYVSARQALGHLPNIGNGRVYGCIKFPDHRVFAPMNEVTRKLIKAVPLDPPGQCLQDAVRQGLVPAYLYEDRKELGRSYQRIKGDGLVPTIVTRMLPHDGRNGACVHWEYDRPLTIEEARNAQGIRPCEVIIGSPAQQMRMVGNAVDRHQGEPLGLALRRAEQQSK
ncbi:S-adenosyl-L-methionine-dependent methyltransferase [Massarina eburnea CBS 473.64]|uniref:DNA (cytosine-5-)-methyltransferase n=1 Tax=Massarina eburnea CBS 473.64 TaxID=1395130 RepID=A0A6A6RYQ4_9PLEO|nr:S-adenosyl-L-methionine-dependent methyltransferase [Massarina eburnea CBS 473.64]